MYGWMMTDDMELVREFATRQSDAAFETLVSRHLNLVYSVALRQVRDPHLAQEVAQAVFIILARKAKSLGPDTILSGWLFRTAQYASADALKSQWRRQHREQEAYMQSILNEPEFDSSRRSGAEAEAWTQIAPLLDAAMLRLGEKDRSAILLRYFENKNLREVGAALGASEDSARVRINRALEKLRKFFTKRGVMLSATVIATAVSANSVQAAPVGLAATISAAAVKSSAVAASTLTLVKGALKLMAWTNMKTVAVAGVTVLLAIGTTTVTIHQIRKPKYDPKDFWATTYPTGSPDMMQYMTNSYGHPLTYTFPIEPVQRCSISGLLDQCMEISGWRYLIDKDVSAGSVEFGCPKVLNGQEWVTAFENALQTNTPEWWVPKKKGFRKENLVLIRFPKEKIVLVLPKDKVSKYQ
jgi:RNA polymerase sigma factor (sigma-70 family)